MDNRETSIITGALAGNSRRNSSTTVLLAAAEHETYHTQHSKFSSKDPFELLKNCGARGIPYRSEEGRSAGACNLSAFPFSPLSFGARAEKKRQISPVQLEKEQKNRTSWYFFTERLLQHRICRRSSDVSTAEIALSPTKERALIS